MIQKLTLADSKKIISSGFESNEKIGKVVLKSDRDGLGVIDFKVVRSE